MLRKLRILEMKMPLWMRVKKRKPKPLSPIKNSNSANTANS